MAEPTTGRDRLMRSVRFRITALATIAVAAVVLATAFALLAAQRRTLTGQLDEAMTAAVVDLSISLEDDTIGSGPVLAGFGDDDAVLQVVDPDGTVLASTANVDGRPPVVAGAVGQRSTIAGLLRDGATYRVLIQPIGDGSRSGRVIAAASLDDIDESVAALRTSLAVVLPIVVALLAALVWWLVGRTLRPVDGIRAEVAEISGSELHRRVPEPGTGDEIDRLAHTMNAMLGRVERASLRQAQFVADASHELRSPLTRMRSELEVDLAHPASADLAETHRSVLEETIGLQHLVDDLLLLARADAGAPLARTEVVDLDELVRAAVAGTGHEASIDTTALAPVQVQADPSQLARAIGNVVENAVRHARSTVALSLEVQGDRAVLAVDDDGPGIAPVDRERVFERFTRLDGARTGSSGGAGLGLAILREIVERHHGTVVLGESAEGGVRVVISLPCAD
jgi:signal transduction histidine kinase